MGDRRFGRFPRHRFQVQRTPEGSLDVPILLEVDGDEQVVGIATGKEEILQHLSNQSVR